MQTTNIFIDVTMLPSLMTNNDWTWSIKKNHQIKWKNKNKDPEKKTQNYKHNLEVIFEKTHSMVDSNSSFLNLYKINGGNIKLISNNKNWTSHMGARFKRYLSLEKLSSNKRNEEQYKKTQRAMQEDQYNKSQASNKKSSTYKIIKL